MSQTLNDVDKFYHDLAAEVLAEGTPKGDRTGTGTKAVVGRMGRFNLMNRRVPRLTTKPIIGDNPEEEMFWFISGDTNIKMLRDKGIGIWNSWLIPGTATYRPCTVRELEKRLIKHFTPNSGYAAIAFETMSADEATTLGRDARYDINHRPKTPQVTAWLHPILWKQLEQVTTDTQGDFTRAVYEWMCKDLKISTEYLTGGDIGKGGYGAQWRNWEDTQLVSEAELEAYLAQGYTKLGAILPVIEPQGEEAIKAALEAHFLSKGSAYASIGTADPLMLPRCGYEMVGDQNGVHVLYLDEKALAVAYIIALDIPRFVVYRKIDQLQNSIDLLKSTPDSRRIIVSAWNPALTWKAALPPCHLYFQFVSHELTVLQRVAIFNDRTMLAERDHARSNEYSFVTWETLNVPAFTEALTNATPEQIEAMHVDLDNRGVKRRNVNCFLLLRSNDLGLGMPFNITQYAALTHMVSQLTDMEPGELIWAAVDAHIYNDHVAGLTEQLQRSSTDCIPRIVLDKKVTSIDDFNIDTIGTVDYESRPPLTNKMLPSI